MFARESCQAFDRRVVVGLSHYVIAVAVSTPMFFFLSKCIETYSLLVASFFVSVLFAKLTFVLTKAICLSGIVDPENKAVLITGCDSGFGHHLARRLDSKGYRVFACCLFPSGEGSFELERTCSKRLQVIALDVTKDGSVQKAVDIVKNNLGDCELWAIVNNAGIHKGADGELTSMEDFTQTLDVNTLGPIRVTKAFLPLLRESRGRVVNVTSLAGRLSQPHLCAYCVSKFAAVGFSESLRQEVGIFGIRVISVEPEYFTTAMCNAEVIGKSLEASYAALDDDLKTAYGEAYLKSIIRYTTTIARCASTKVEIVIDALDKAVSLEHPDPVYECSRNFLYHFNWCIFLKGIPRPAADFVMKVHSVYLGIPLRTETRHLL